MAACEFRVVIPARFASTRLPGKPLLELAGRPMLQHVHERALRSGAAQVLIATDDDRIRAAAENFGAAVCMTAADHQSGTERLGEVAAAQGWADDVIVVNVQGDEPLIPPALIAQAAQDLAAQPSAQVSTLAYPCAQDELQDPNVVKLVLDRAGFALYFSRAPIPYRRDAQAESSAQALRHLGLYAYRAGFLARYRLLEPSPLEYEEKLEQLRVLWHGLKIHVSVAVELPGQGVDTAEDLERVARLLEQDG